MNPFKPFNLFLVVQLLCCLLFLSSMNAHAHSEHDKARFVAPSGKDIGRCDNRFRPCKTIAYAASKASKGDLVLVAAGSYHIQSKEDLYYLTSKMVPVRGGYSLRDHFQTQHPSANETLLIGLPAPFHQQVFDNGFTSLRDGKATLNEQDMSATIAELTQPLTSQSQSACEGGLSSGFGCENVSLLSHMLPNELLTNATEANDIWGHVDLNTGKEYAIIGLRNGVAVVNVSTPTSPKLVGGITGQIAGWRDIKVYQRFNTSTLRWQAWAYVTADGASQGLMVVDLNDLSNGVTLANTDTTDIRAHNVYIAGLDYSLNITNSSLAPQMSILGANNYAGALRTYDLKNPISPQPAYVPINSGSGDYSHDASSVMINDERAQRDCPNVNNGQCSVLIDFNENTLRLWDNTGFTSAEKLSDTEYPRSAYTHSGWWSEDRQYIFLHDEGDEINFGINSTLKVFEISDLTAPQLVGEWTGSTRSIDHNGYVRGNRYYMSNYERGLTIIDISNPVSPREIGFFDTFPNSNNAAFNGAWGVYPFLPSGIILVSDIQRGLFILQDETLPDQTNIGFADSSYNVEEGDSATITVSKTGSAAMTVNYDVVLGEARENDMDFVSGQLSWAEGDSADKILSIPVNVDQRDESNETFFVTLHTPRGGYLNPAARMTSVVIQGENQLAGHAQFLNASLTVRENQTSLTIKVVRSGGSIGELRVPLAFAEANASDDLNLNQVEVVWPDGNTQEQNIVLNIIDDDATEAQEQFTLTMGQAITSIIIRDDESNQAPNANAGNDMSVNARANVSLRGSSSDPENMPLTTVWEQISGPSVTISNSTSETSQFTAPNESAVLAFRFTVTDDFGVTSFDEVQVTVAAPVVNEPSTQGSSGGGTWHWSMLILIVIAGLTRHSRVD